MRPVFSGYTDGLPVFPTTVLDLFGNLLVIGVAQLRKHHPDVFSGEFFPCVHDCLWKIFKSNMGAVAMIWSKRSLCTSSYGTRLLVLVKT